MNAGRVVMEVDPLMAQTVVYRNAFNLSSGVAASAFHIVGGVLDLQFVDGWRGVAFQGSADQVLYATPYGATITGSLASVWQV